MLPTYLPTYLHDISYNQKVAKGKCNNSVEVHAQLSHNRLSMADELVSISWGKRLKLYLPPCFYKWQNLDHQLDKECNQLVMNISHHRTSFISKFRNLIKKSWFLFFSDNAHFLCSPEKSWIKILTSKFDNSEKAVQRPKPKKKSG
jgi:hypothetical protein